MTAWSGGQTKSKAKAETGGKGRKFQLQNLLVLNLLQLNNFYKPNYFKP